MQSPPSRLFTIGLLGLLILSTLGFACIYWRIYGAEKLFGDFDIFYTAARNAAAHRLAAIYAVTYLRELLAADSKAPLLFFLNPPTALFLVAPFAALDHAPALFLWTVLQIILLGTVLRSEYIRRLFYAQSPQAIPTSMLLLIPFMAFSLQNILFGQVALLCTSLFLLVFALRNSHPVWAGVMLGIFSFKPQLGILLPVLLIAEKNWKVLLWAAITASLMIVLSLGVFGTGLWQDYSETLRILSAFLAKPQPTLFALTTSPYAALRNLDVAASAAMACQCAVSLIVLALLWPVLQNGRESYKILLVSLGTYLVTPYSLIYDIPLLAIPCALLLRRTEADKARMPELLALLLLILLPLVAILLQIMHFPYSFIAISAAFGVARRLPLREP